MSVPMPMTVVLVVCRVISHGGDANSKYTQWEDLDWDLSQSVMHCRTQEVDAPPGMPCQTKGGAMAAMQYDMALKGSKERVWRHACPVPIIDTRTGDIIAWHMPSCTEAHRDTVVCENPHEI